jgi:hypothetical protein
LRTVVWRIPIRQQRHFGPVVQPYTRNVDGPAEGVFRQPRACLVVAGAASIMRHDTQRRYAAPFPTNRRQNTPLDPCLERRGRAAVNRRLRTERHTRNRTYAHRILDPTCAGPRHAAKDLALNCRITADLASQAGLTALFCRNLDAGRPGGRAQGGCNGIGAESKEVQFGAKQGTGLRAKGQIGPLKRAKHGPDI